MAFVVDSAEWCFDGWSEFEAIGAVESLLDRISQAGARGEKVWIGQGLQTRLVLGGADLWSLRSPDSPIKFSPEIWQELTAWLTNPAYYEEAEQPLGVEVIDIEVGQNLPASNPDAAWAHHHVRTGYPMGCFGLRRRGKHLTTTAYGIATLHWITDESEHREFWRDSIIILGGGKEVLRERAPHAYPDLYFPATAWGGLNDLSSYLALRQEIWKYLGVLDDSAHWVFTFPPPALIKGEPAGPDRTAAPSQQVIEKRFQNLGLVLSPEKPNVFARKECRTAREIVISDLTLYCHWHAKLQPHIDRIHIHPPVAQSRQKVVVAIFHKHLPLP